MKTQVVKAQTVIEFGAPLQERVSELPPRRAERCSCAFIHAVSATRIFTSTKGI